MRIGAFIVLFSACRPAVDAPDTIEEMVVFGMVHFEEPGHLEAIADALLIFTEDHPEELAEGYAVDDLSSDDLALIGVDEPDIRGVVGAMGSSRFRVDPVLVADALSGNKDEVFTTMELFEVVEEGDRACFLEQTCAQLDQVIHEIGSAPFIGSIERDILQSFRWVEMADGRLALANRQLVPEAAEVGNALVQIEQQYDFSLTFPLDDGCLRAQTVWAEGRVVGAELPEGWVVRQAVGVMQGNADAVDAYFLDGEAP